MDKPIKPTDLMPRSFGGVKSNFSASMQSTGFEDSVPAIYGGDNLNYQLDATGKELDYCEKICDFINALPIGKGITVDVNNKLVYANYGTDITGKANVSLDNLNANGKARIAVKEYLVTETYIQGDVVLAIIDDEVKLFKSLINNNTGNALSDDTKWEEASFVKIDQSYNSGSTNAQSGTAVAQAINGKADVDLANVNNSGTSRGAGWATPSNTYVDLTIGSSGATYTALSNGYILLKGAGGYNGGYAGMEISQSGLATGTGNLQYTEVGVCFMPVKKNDTFFVNYNNFSLSSFRFIYAVGSESEAS